MKSTVSITLVCALVTASTLPMSARELWRGPIAQAVADDEQHVARGGAPTIDPRVRDLRPGPEVVETVSREPPDSPAMQTVTAQPSDWSRVRAVLAGSNVIVAVRGKRTRKWHFKAADDLQMVVADSYSNERKFARTDVLEVKTVTRQGGAAAGAVGGAVGGLFIGVLLGVRAGDPALPRSRCWAYPWREACSVTRLSAAQRRRSSTACPNAFAVTRGDTRLSARLRCSVLRAFPAFVGSNDVRRRVVQPEPTARHAAATEGRRAPMSISMRYKCLSESGGPILVVTYAGTLAPGSKGNADANRMVAFLSAALADLPPVGVVLDLTDVKYVWGDAICGLALPVLNLWQGAGHGIPLAIVAMGRTARALAPLLEPRFALGVVGAKLLPDITAALGYVRSGRL